MRTWTQAVWAGALAVALAWAVVAAAAPGARGEEPDIQYVEDEPAQDGGATSPFARSAEGPHRRDAVPGHVELSNGLKVPGFIYTTRAKRLKVFNLQREGYEYVPVPACERIEAAVEWERVDEQWRWKEAGSTERVYTGKAYPVRMLKWRLTLHGGHRIEGHILGQPIYVEHNGKRERFILHKRGKGDLDETLDDLVYIRRVAFGPKAYNEAVDELKAKATAAERK